MTNEFKIKKGLVVTGSGGTLLDVQGSVGQLFSVTDSLTGDLFSVSDISGVPILNVNSSGAINVDGTIESTGNITCHKDAPKIILKDIGTGNAMTSEFSFHDGNGVSRGYLGYGSSGNSTMYWQNTLGDLQFHTSSALCLTLSGTSATFVGAISTPTGSTFAGAIKITETGTAQHILIGNQDSGGTDKPAMIQGVNGQLNLGFGSSWSSEGGTMTDTLSLEVTGNATFAGTVTAPQHFKASGNNLSLSAGAVQVLNIDLNRKIYPNTDNSTDLGYSTTQNRFRHGYFTGNMYVGDNLVMKGDSPTISLLDNDTNADDFYIHINSNNFYVLTNRTNSEVDVVNTGWETPHVLQLEADTNIGYLFGHKIFNENYHPNADIWTSARTITLGGDLSGSVSINGSANVTLTAAVANDSHTHDGRYFTESESNAKFLTKDGSAKEWVFEVNDEGNISGNRWYKVATVNEGSGGLHIRGHISNHVETFGSQKFDLAIQGRETSPTVEVNGQVDIFHNASGSVATDKCGIRVVRGTDETNYDKFYVWIRTTRYTQLRLHLTKSGNTSFHTSPTMVTTEPVPLSPVTTPEIDTSTYAEGGYIIVDSLAALSCKTSGTSVVGSLTAAADVIAYSDERLKENVKTLDGSKVLQMRGVSFDRLDNGKYSSGVIAQELEKVAPELVIDDGKYKGVAYGNITGYLIEAIKEQQKQINELKSQMAACNKTTCNCNCNCKN
tara:strand:- start:119 stop:2293 length:2175 start_codon:yes stop_codon:yes gene_type:complete